MNQVVQTNLNLSWLFSKNNLGCEGCNGGITYNPEEYFGDYTAQAVRLMPFLIQEYSQEFVDNICLVKMDTEECWDL